MDKVIEIRRSESEGERYVRRQEKGGIIARVQAACSSHYVEDNEFVWHWEHIVSETAVRGRSEASRFAKNCETTA